MPIAGLERRDNMSQHKSLKTERFKQKRNVEKRWERIAKLKRNEKWVESMSVYGLPKDKILRLKLKIKEEKKEAQQDLIDLARPKAVTNEKK